MPYSLNLQCRSCGLGSGGDDVVVEFQLCYCKSCDRITPTQALDYTFAPGVCAVCEKTVRRHELLAPLNLQECPRCEKRELRQLSDVPHISMAFHADRLPYTPPVGEIVHGFVERRGARGQIVRINIEHAREGSSRTVPREPGYPHGTPVECRVVSAGGSFLELVILRVVNPEEY